MLNVDRVWARISRRPEFVGKKLDQFGVQTVNLRYDGLTSGEVVSNQTQNFPNGAIILGICGAAALLAQAATPALSSGLGMFALQMQFQQQRSVIGQVAGIASSVFGVYNDQFPAVELLVPTNGILLYTFENLTSSTISITIAHHCLVPVNVG